MHAIYPIQITFVVKSIYIHILFQMSGLND